MSFKWKTIHRSSHYETPIVLISLFDGVGAAGLAVEALGLPLACEYYCEIDPDARFVSERHHAKMDKARKRAGARRPMRRAIGGDSGDVQQITRAELKRIVRRWGSRAVYLVVGGSPCQDLSAANLTRQGILGKKSKLFFTLIDIIAVVDMEVQALRRRERQSGPGCVLYLVENVASMSLDNLKIFSGFLNGGRPVRLGGEMFARPMERNRVYFTNLMQHGVTSQHWAVPAYEICQQTVSAVVRMHLNCSFDPARMTGMPDLATRRKPDTYLDAGRRIGPGLRAFKTITCSEKNARTGRWQNCQQDNRVFPTATTTDGGGGGGGGGGGTRGHGHGMPLNAREMCRLFGFPVDLLDCLRDREGLQTDPAKRAKVERRLIGNTFLLDQIAYLLFPLHLAFHGRCPAVSRRTGQRHSRQFEWYVGYGIQFSLAQAAQWQDYKDRGVLTMLANEPSLLDPARPDPRAVSEGEQGRGSGKKRARGGAAGAGAGKKKLRGIKAKLQQDAERPGQMSIQDFF
eukprot:g4872.t1